MTVYSPESPRNPSLAKYTRSITFFINFWANFRENQEIAIVYHTLHYNTAVVYKIFKVICDKARSQNSHRTMFQWRTSENDWGRLYK